MTIANICSAVSVQRRGRGEKSPDVCRYLGRYHDSFLSSESVKYLGTVPDCTWVPQYSRS